MIREINETNIKQFELALIEDEKSASTVEKYMRDVKKFCKFASDSDITKELVVRYKAYLMENYAPSSVNSMLAAVNLFFKAQGWHDCTVKSIRIQRQGFRTSERELTKKEYYKLLNAAEKKKNRRLYMLMQTICSTGIRVSELQFITVEAVRAGRAIVFLKGKCRQVIIPSALSCELSEYVKERKINSGSIFVTRSGKPVDRNNILHEMKSLCSIAGVQTSKVFPHNLRHLFACMYYTNEKDLSRLADILGHSSIDTTRIYTSVSGDEQQQQIESLGLVVERKKLPHDIHYAVKK